MGTFEVAISGCMRNPQAHTETRYNRGDRVIKTFRNDETERLYLTGKSRKFQVVEKGASRKLRMLDAAKNIDDLAVPPGNRLEQLKGDRQGQFSIRINDQYRICFDWTPEGAYNIEIADYH